MASQKLQFDIGSTFSGEGFKQAQVSVGNLNKGVRAAATTASQMSSALGGLDTSAAKAMGALTGMMQSLMTLNATAIITQSAMIAITAFINKCNDEVEELTRRTADLKASVDQAFNRTLAASVAEVHAEIKNISGDFDRVTSQAAAFQAALMGLKGSVATGGIINLEVAKVNEMLAAHSEAEKAQIEATYNLKIATEKAAAQREQWNGKIEAAQTAVAKNAERVALYDQELAAVQAKRAELEEARLQAAVADKAKAAQIQAEIDKLAQTEANIRTQQNALREKSKALELQEQQAMQDAANAEMQASIAVTQAAAKIDDLKQAAENLAHEQQEAAQKQDAENRLKEEKAAQLKAEKTMHEEAQAAQKAVNDAARDVAEAEQAYAAALAAYNANFADNKMMEGVFDSGKGSRRSSAVPVRIDSTIKAEVVAKGLEDALKEGLITSVKDMDKFQRQRARDLDRDEKQRFQQLEREKARYDQLQERNRKSWSKSDADFAAKFEKLKEAAEAKKREVQDAKARLEEAKKIEADNHKNLQEINKKLEKLGLK